MSRKPVAYVKPQDPSFLVRLKKEAGYKEGPTVDTKREQRQLDSGSDEEQDQQPTVVVLQDGDLTAEQAQQVQKDKDKAEALVKADLTKPIVFQKPEKSKRPAEADNKEKGKKKRKSGTEGNKKLLSFDEEDE